MQYNLITNEKNLNQRKQTQYFSNSKRRSFSDFFVFESKIAIIPRLYSAVAVRKQLRKFFGFRSI